MSNSVDYFEVGSPDPDASKAFYGQLFSWKVGDPSAQQYRMINDQAGGLWDTSKMGGTNWAIFYVHVDDVEEAIKKAESLGAKVVIPVVSNENLTFAHLIDPQGNRFGVWKPNHK